MANSGLVGSNKRFLYTAVEAPGSTHDATLPKECPIYITILDEDIMPDKTLPQYVRLLEMCNENTRDKQQKYLNKRLCGARVVTENAYGMLKSRWRFLHKNQNADFATYVTLS